MKNEAEIIWWKTVKQDVETTPLGFTEAAARVEGADAVDGAESIFKRGCSLSIIIIYFGPPPKLPADRFARITFFVKYEITYRNFCGGRGGLRHE
ncbi:hypothetical protein ALC56_13509 [Trachymyrmex septentrionalis]|uniref:Uncharacterized protein n=1 Tax=Trachymyrmex septentrionalis TaxID=34720 RepID=A0A195EVF3_9HYME|nr:hypothetical protein ALC56_13509 [Trachymyrmex septentrionalis]